MRAYIINTTHINTSTHTYIRSDNIELTSNNINFHIRNSSGVVEIMIWVSWVTCGIVCDGFYTFSKKMKVCVVKKILIFSTLELFSRRVIVTVIRSYVLCYDFYYIIVVVREGVTHKYPLVFKKKNP